ncbi:MULTISPECIES: HIT domain-containing protein [Salinicola]|uniref:Histidine triad protein n=1 Tax=Salinicola socius TaxID=404433 RepID=A0A1Q8SUS6_9GAMM|nr:MULTISPECIES: HIT domain-containing protein [Salinicola]OLO05157.1 histidine triad protein [Salinicola socius]
MPNFTLDSRLQQDSVHIIDLALCQVRLSRDARYPWVILIPQRERVVEVYELGTDEQATLWQEASQLGQAMMRHYGGDKLNIATLGNQVPQLHVHLIVRFQDDAAWPGPVWGQGSAETYDAEALEQRREEIARLASDAGVVR